MRTIKFSSIYEPAKERHNLENAKVVFRTIFGKDVQMYTPCNLNIFIGNGCHNNCAFCINKAKGDIDDKQYFYALEQVLDELSNKDVEITITGGEPTLYAERFVKTIELLHKKGFPCRTVSTTGKNLLTGYNGKPLIQYLVENDYIYNLNISRMSLLDEVNDNIMQGTNITNKELEKIALFCDVNDVDLRVSCNLIPTSVNSYYAMMSFVDIMHERGIKTVMFRELEGVSDYVQITPIMQKIAASEDFTFIKEAKGMVYAVKQYRYFDDIVKVYENNPIINKDVMFSMSFNNGILRKGFCGDILKEIAND